MLGYKRIAIGVVLALGVNAFAQTEPATAPAEPEAELTRLRAENAALRNAFLQGLAIGPGNLQSRYNALKLDRDRAVEQLQIAQEQLIELRAEIDRLRSGASTRPASAR